MSFKVTTKIRPPDCESIPKCLHSGAVKEEVLQKEYLSETLEPIYILNNLSFVNKIKFNILYWKPKHTFHLQFDMEKKNIFGDFRDYNQLSAFWNYSEFSLWLISTFRYICLHLHTNALITYSMLFTGREVRRGKNCARNLEYGPRPQGRGLYSRARAQFFPIRTDLAR